MAHVCLCWCSCQQTVEKFSFFTRFDKVPDSFDTNWLLNDLIARRLKKKDMSDLSKEGKGSSKKLSGATKTSWWGSHYLDIMVYSKPESFCMKMYNGHNPKLRWVTKREVATCPRIPIRQKWSFLFWDIFLLIHKRLFLSRYVNSYLLPTSVWINWNSQLISPH